MTRADLARTLEALARRRTVWALVLIAALATRMAFVTTAPNTIPWPDGRANELAGWRLASEHRYTADFFLTPAYPVFVGAVYSVTGRNLRALRVADASVSTVTVGLIGLFGALLLTPGAGLVAALLAAVHPVMAYLPIAHYTENLLLLLTTLAFGVTGLALLRPSNRRWLAAGVLFGLAMLSKPTVVLLLPGFALGAVLRLRPHGWGRLARWGALFAVALALTILPWMARCHRHEGRWYLISAGGGRVFWMGNNPGYRGTTSLSVAVPDSMMRAMEALPNYADQEATFYRAGMRFIREQPARAAQLYLMRLGNLWALYPRTQTRTGLSVALADWAQGVCSALLFAGALLGTRRSARAGLAAFPLGVVSCTLVLSCYYTVLRYRMSFEVLVIWLASLGITSWLGRGAGPAAEPPASR